MMTYFCPLYIKYAACIKKSHENILILHDGVFRVEVWLNTRLLSVLIYVFPYDFFVENPDIFFIIYIIIWK